MPMMSPKKVLPSTQSRLIQAGPSATTTFSQPRGWGRRRERASLGTGGAGRGGWKGTSQPDEVMSADGCCPARWHGDCQRKGSNTPVALGGERILYRFASSTSGAVRVLCLSVVNFGIWNSRACDKACLLPYFPISSLPNVWLVRVGNSISPQMNPLVAILAQDLKVLTMYHKHREIS